MNKYKERLERIRSMMRAKGWDAIVITASDPHSSEYPAKCWKQVLWCTGFAGECGDIVITPDHAGLWTDTRYFIAANAVLPGTGFELHKTRVPGQVLIPQWLAGPAFGRLDRKVVVAVDGQTHSTAAVQSIKKAFEAAGRTEDSDAEDGYRIVNAPDLLDELWEDRPELPVSPIISLGDEVTGESRQHKIAWLRDFLMAHRCDSMLLTSLDEIAWLLNVRGSDVEYNPVVISYLIVSQDSVEWYVTKDAYIDVDGETAATFDALKQEGIKILPYGDIGIALSQHSMDETLFVDPATLNYNLHYILSNSGAANAPVYGESPVPLRKSIKNETEIANMKRAHVLDGVALEKFYYWLEKEMEMGDIVTEWSAAQKLESFREEIPGYMGPSFETISGYGPGGALPHYVTPRVDAPRIEEHGLFLCDSGGQFSFGGTTDITRTVPVGPTTQLEREDYTLVLKCHIDLASAVFPEGTCGCHLDILARNPLWQRMRNFGHGTGHGVGALLCVHEGPQEFRQNFNAYPFVPGIVNTDEPGIYREGKHGVRHENVFVVVPAGETEFGRFYKFDTITMCHIDTSIIVRDLMTQDELDWLNSYHAKVYETLSPLLPKEVAEWLKGKCQAI